MKRRKFLQNISAVTGIAIVPKPILGAVMAKAPLVVGWVGNVRASSLLEGTADHFDPHFASVTLLAMNSDGNTTFCD